VIPRLQAPSGKPTKLEYVSCAHLAAARDFLQQSLRSQVCQGSRNVASPLNDNQNQRDIFCRLCVCTYAPACVRMLVYLPLLLSDGKDSGHDTLIATSVSGKPSTINCRASFRPSIGTSGFQRTCTHTHSLRTSENCHCEFCCGMHRSCKTTLQLFLIRGGEHIGLINHEDPV